MSSLSPARAAGRRPLSIVLAAACAVTSVVGVFAHAGLESGSAPTSARPAVVSARPSTSPGRGLPIDETAAPLPAGRATGGRHGGPGEADGVVPGDVSVFDEEVPAVANLRPALLDALRDAAADAARDGVELRVNSGWRSAAYQEHLLRQAIEEHGSPEEASRWVATPETSEHVSGDAVDVGGHDAVAWLAEHGAAYGLCQIYDNEPWHVELRPEAPVRGCPDRYADPTHDPRMQPP